MALEQQMIHKGITSERLATPRAGVVFHDTAKKQVQPYGSAWEVELSRGKADTSTTTYTGDQGATKLLGTGYTFPANSLVSGRSIRVVAYGFFDTDPTVAPSMTFSVVAVDSASAVTVLCTTGSFLLLNNLTAMPWQLEASVTATAAAGAAAAMECQGHLVYHTSAIASVHRAMSNTATVALKTTDTETIKMRAAISTGNINDDIVLRSLQVHWMGGT